MRDFPHISIGVLVCTGCGHWKARVAGVVTRCTIIIIIIILAAQVKGKSLWLVQAMGRGLFLIQV